MLEQSKGRIRGLLGETHTCSICGEIENPYYKVSSPKTKPYTCDRCTIKRASGLS